MADKQDEWLDRELAERLLRGDSLDNAVDPAARDKAERLAKTLGALSQDPPPDTLELPGEEAALAAFRKAHADRGTLPAGPARADHGDRAAAHADVGLVRISGRHGRTAPVARPRRSRPVRLALAAALAFGLAGGVAAAAGAGLLPTPFGDAEPGPNASVSAAVPSDRPLVSPSPPEGTGEGEATPDGSSGASANPGGGRDTARDGASGSPGTGTDEKDGKFGSWWSKAPSACRDLRDGKQLSGDRRRALEGLAGGSTRVWKFCQGVLGTSAGTRSDTQPGTGEDRDGAGKDQDGNGGRGKGDDDGHDDGHDSRSGGGGNGRGNGGGNRHDEDGGRSTAEPDTAAPLLPKQAATSPEPAPSPSYSTL